MNDSGSTDEGLSVLYSGDVMTTLQDVLAMNDTIRFRMYEVNTCKTLQEIGIV